MASDIPSSSAPNPELAPEANENGTKTPEAVEADSFLNDEGEPVVENEPEQPAEPVTPAAAEAQNAEFDAGDVIAAQPITIVAPGSSSIKKTRDPVEMAKSPAWLPEGWTVETKARTNGVTAGLIDRYYRTPDKMRKFRSKVEVFNYLDKLKSGSEAGPSESPSSKKKRKSSSKPDDGASGSGGQKKRKYTRKPKQAAAAAPETAAAEVPSSEEVPVQTVEQAMEGEAGAGGEGDGLAEENAESNGETEAAES